MKYTPSWIWKAEPIADALLAYVVANELSAAIVVFPNKPDVIIILEDNSSPSENVCVVLLVVFELR